MSPMDGANRLIKEIEDKILASFILLIISPVLLFLAAGVKLSSPGPIFYRQERVSLLAAIRLRRHRRPAVFEPGRTQIDQPAAQRFT